MFTRKQIQKMNNNRYINGYYFDQILVNKNILAFNVVPAVADSYENDPYTKNGRDFINVAPGGDALLTSEGAKDAKIQLKMIYENQRRMDDGYDLPDDQFNRLCDDVNFSDIDLNDDLKYIVKNNRIDSLKSNIFDGNEGDAIGEDGEFHHPEVYQILSDDLCFEGSGDLNQCDALDDVGFDLVYDEDFKDQIKDLEKYKDEVYYVITNFTRPLINNEDFINDGQSAEPALIGRELTKETAGLYIATANTKKNRKKVDTILSKYSPGYVNKYRNMMQSLGFNKEGVINE